MSDPREQSLKDAADLHQYGYAQQLLRDMGGFANFALSFTIISILTGAVVLFGHGLNYGGPVVNGWGWPLVTLATLLVAASMAEIASAVPTAGAVYHWAALLGGPDWGWFTAWFNFIGQMATTAGIGYGIAQFVVDLLGWEGRAALLAVYAAVLLSQGLLNHYGIRTVARLNDVSVWYHIALTAVLIGAFLAWAPMKPLSFAFAGTHSSRPDLPFAWVFLVGLLQAQWTLTGYDASAHITEETLDPRRNAPWGMFLAVLVSGVAGWAMLLVMTLGIQDLGAAAAAPNPFLFVCETALGPAWGRALTWAVLVAMWFCGLGSVTANARMVFAFARDGGLPGSARLATVSPSHRTPAVAVWTSVAAAFLVALYSGAFGVIVSISTIGLYVSYIIPVVLALRARRRGAWGPGASGEFALGPWNLGAWGGLVNALAAAWVAFICVLFVAPPNQLTGYTFAGLTAALAVYYLAAVRGTFKGPQKLMTEEELLRAEAALGGAA